MLQHPALTAPQTEVVRLAVRCPFSMGREQLAPGGGQSARAFRGRAPASLPTDTPGRVGAEPSVHWGATGSREEQEEKERASHAYRLPALRGERGGGRRRANADEVELSACTTFMRRCAPRPDPYLSTGRLLFVTVGHLRVRLGSFPQHHQPQQCSRHPYAGSTSQRSCIYIHDFVEPGPLHPPRAGHDGGIGQVHGHDQVEAHVLAGVFRLLVSAHLLRRG